MHSVSALPRPQLRLRQVGTVFLGTALLALSSYIEVPMFPVPMTMQTLAVTFIGAFYGWRLGAITVLAWLGEAAFGLPVLAGGASGFAPFAGPTAGYLMAFPVAAMVSGLIAGPGNHLLRNLAAMVAGNAICLMGALWLARLVGPEMALYLGVIPFALGALVKSGIGAVALALLRR
ncbi:MAG: biotin transporter BioY [Rhizomicrobium sp.]